MPRRIIASVIGALAAASLAAPVAHAGTPAKVKVRVEAPGRTIVSTTVTTLRQKVVKDGNAAHSCSGTSVAGALELATGGNWTATWFDGLGYAVDAFDGVAGAADFSSYWTLWVNGKSSMTGVCDTELQAGDEVLEYLCQVGPDFSCTNLPLALSAGKVRLTRDVAFTRVKVVRLAVDGSETPVAGATVRGGLEAVKTGADGTARVELRALQSKLRATLAGDVPSAPLHCTLGNEGGSCGSSDTTPPELRLRGLADGDVIAAADAPRELRGIASDPSGATVALRLTRRFDGRCQRFDGEREAFRRCNGKGAPLVEVGDRTRWSYLLPARLAAGRYGLVVIAVDPAGNRSRVKVNFTVEAAG